MNCPIAARFSLLKNEYFSNYIFHIIFIFPESFGPLSGCENSIWAQNPFSKFNLLTKNAIWLFGVKTTAIYFILGCDTCDMKIFILQESKSRCDWTIYF